MDLSYCPRCSGFSYEHLKTYAFCLDCAYSADVAMQDRDLVNWRQIESKIGPSRRKWRRAPHEIAAFAYLGLKDFV